MKKILMVLLIVGILLVSGCGRDEPVNDTPEWITPDEKGWIWKIGYIPAKAIHEILSGMWYGIWGDEPDIRKDEK